MAPWGKVARKTAEEVSVRLVRQAIRKAGSRMAGKILVGSAAWLKAFEHIAEHFAENLVVEKGTHGVFKAALRSRGALEPLVSQAVRRPSSTLVGRAAVHGVFAGRICVILEREFAEEIGEELRVEAGGVIKRTGAKILRVIVDVRGKPITAFPVTKFFVP